MISGLPATYAEALSPLKNNQDMNNSRDFPSSDNTIKKVDHFFQRELNLDIKEDISTGHRLPCKDA